MCSLEAFGWFCATGKTFLLCSTTHKTCFCLFQHMDQKALEKQSFHRGVEKDENLNTSWEQPETPKEREGTYSCTDATVQRDSPERQKAEELTRVSRSRDRRHMESGPMRTCEGTLLFTEVFPADEITLHVFIQDYSWACSLTRG